MRPSSSFDKFDRETDRWFKAFFGVWIIWAVLVLAFWVGVIYVAVHFIGKWW